jgi:6-phosphogluconolactonase (cycloisomerase 2 family)
LIVPGSPNDVVAPTAITVLSSGAAAYVSAYDSTANRGYVFGFSVASGSLTPLNGGAPLAGMLHPSAIASDPSGKFVYVTDTTADQLFAYAVNSDGSLSTLGSTLPTGNQPSAIIADPNYPYLYVANALDGNVEAYSISPSGSLSFLGGSTTPVLYPAGIQPLAIGIDPSTHHFLFTLNFLSNGAAGTISDFEIDTASGALVHAQRSPYNTSAQPTAVAAVPKGKPQK